MTERERFVDAHLRDDCSVAELCRRFGISRKTGYKWLSRWFAGCELVDRSRRPHCSPHAVARWIEEAIVDARKQRPRWGAQETAGRIAARQSRGSAAVGQHVRSHLQAQRTHPATSSPPPDAAILDAVRPGRRSEFALVRRLQGAVPCRELALLSAHSHRRIQPLPDRSIGLRSPSTRPVRRAFELIFGEHGVPDAIRTDNGSPFASRGLAGLSRLSAWWIKLGIRHERAMAGGCGFEGFERVAYLSDEQPTRSRSWRTGERHADAERTGRRSRFTSSKRGERAAGARRAGA
jgi:putative transposase